MKKKQTGVWDEKSKTYIKSSGTVKQGRRPMFKPFDKNDDDTCPKCGSASCTHAWELDTPEAEGRRKGAMIAQLLSLRHSREHADRYDTSQGTKTDLGLYRTVKGIIDGSR
jgi:hypothetical protein